MVNFQDFESLMNLLSKLTLLALPVALAACGGGGSSDQTCSSDLYTLNKTCTQNVSTALPEGIWFGATTLSTAAQTIVLENGQYFSVYTNTSDGSLAWLPKALLCSMRLADPV